MQKGIRGLLQELGLEKAKRPLLHCGKTMIILLHNRREDLLPYLRLSILCQTGPRHIRETVYLRQRWILAIILGKIPLL
jgi:hypothetical protein